MKNLTYNQYVNLIEKTRGTNHYLHIEMYKDAKKNLIPEQFIQLQQQLAKPA
ncbi:hypothetical protein [Wenyingzhuangia sp. IMCC45574]